MKPNLWFVKFTQKDNPSNSFSEVYHTEEEFNKWVKLHESEFDINVQTFIQLRLERFDYPRDAGGKVESELPFKVRGSNIDPKDTEIVGLGYTMTLRDDRDIVTQFVDVLNATIHGVAVTPNKAVKYRNEGYFPDQDSWESLGESQTLREANDWLFELRSVSAVSSPATKFRRARITTEYGPELRSIKK